MTTQNQTNSQEGVILAPSFRLPILIIFLGALLLLLPLKPWPTVIVSSFGFFLLLQSFTLKLQFTEKDLIVLQLGRELRRFPFKNWIAWKLLFPIIPGFFYFREEASPHLLPILFNPKELQDQLKLKVGDLEIKTN
tara:strand:- start:472 stop:879 length:408 start_codon:yes stop_codon:yes gene_type:complete